MTKIRNVVITTIKYANNFVLFAMFVLLLIQVMARKLFNFPLTWPEELAIVAMIWITFLGAYQCTVEDGHLKISFLQDSLSDKVKPWLEILAKGCVAWFLIMINLWAYPFIQKAGLTGMPVTGLPMWIPYGLIWLSCLLMLMETVIQLVNEGRQAFGMFKPKESNSDADRGGE